MRTTHALILMILLLIAGFVATIYHPSAPYPSFITGLIGVFGVYAGKRTLKYHKNFSDVKR